jgi:signal recognition particle subunit SEC65
MTISEEKSIERIEADTIEEVLDQLEINPSSIMLMLTMEEDGIGCHVQNPHMWPEKLKQTMCMALVSVLKEIRESMTDEEETVN